MEEFLGQWRLVTYEICGVLFALGLIVGFIAGTIKKPEIRKSAQYLGFGTSLIVTGIAVSIFLTSHGYN